MTDKVTLATLASLENENTAINTINSNSTAIVAGFDNTLSRDGTSPNQMGANLDMNSNQILNLPSPATPNSPARLIDVVNGPTLNVPPVGTSGNVVPLLSGNNTWSGTNLFNGEPVNVIAYGAKCDGVTDDSSAFTAALNASKYVTMPPGKVSVVKNLSVTSTQTLDLNGGVLQAAFGANYIVKLTGFAPNLIKGQVQDPNNYTLISTTLSSLASPGDTSIAVTSNTGLVIGNFIVITMAGGIDHVTKITNISGTTISLLDAIPYTVTSITISSGGTGFTLNDVLVSKGGTGAPMTIVASGVSGGVINTVGINTHGMLKTIPSNPVQFTGGTGAGSTFNLTTAGSVNGSAVRSARGLIVIDQSVYSTVENIRIGGCPIGIEIKGTGNGTPPQYFTNAFRIANITGDSISLMGIAMDVNAQNGCFSNITLYGLFSTFGSRGLFHTAPNPTAASGGHTYVNVNFLQWQVGWWFDSAQLSQFSCNISDTCSNYAWVLNNCHLMTFAGGIYAGFTGPSGVTGVGFIISNTSSFISIGGLITAFNCCDLYIDDLNSTVQLVDEAWGPSRIFSGNGNYNNTNFTFLGGSPGSEAVRIIPINSAANRLELKGNITGNDVQITAEGSDSNVGIDYITKGSGTHSFVVNGTTTSSRIDGTGLTALPFTIPPSGGTTGSGIKVSSTANLGLFFGSGAPTLSAAQGSIYIRTDGSSTSTRLYVNTNGSTTWTNVTTAG